MGTFFWVHINSGKVDATEYDESDNDDGEEIAIGDGGND